MIKSILIVFLALIVIYVVVIKLTGKPSDNSADVSKETKQVGNEIPGEVLTAIFMALHEEQKEVHDIESNILTIDKIDRKYSPWNSKIYGLRQNPQR